MLSAYKEQQMWQPIDVPMDVGGVIVVHLIDELAPHYRILIVPLQGLHQKATTFLFIQQYLAHKEVIVQVVVIEECGIHFIYGVACSLRVCLYGVLLFQRLNLFIELDLAIVREFSFENVEILGQFCHLFRLQQEVFGKLRLVGLQCNYLNLQRAYLLLQLLSQVLQQSSFLFFQLNFLLQRVILFFLLKCLILPRLLLPLLLDKQLFQVFNLLDCSAILFDVSIDDFSLFLDHMIVDQLFFSNLIKETVDHFDDAHFLSVLDG